MRRWKHDLSIAHAPAAIREIHSRLQGRIACASGADRRKVELQPGQGRPAFEYFQGRIFSISTEPPSKPYPDVYSGRCRARWLSILKRCAPPARTHRHGRDGRRGCGCHCVRLQHRRIGPRRPRRRCCSVGALQVFSDMREPAGAARFGLRAAGGLKIQAWKNQAPAASKPAAFLLQWNQASQSTRSRTPMTSEYKTEQPDRSGDRCT